MPLSLKKLALIQALTGDIVTRTEWARLTFRLSTSKMLLKYLNSMKFRLALGLTMFGPI